jgi:hypothetical protein
MKCVALLEEDKRCLRGMPVARLFRHYFCETNPQKCPFLLWEKSLRVDQAIKG